MKKKLNIKVLHTEIFKKDEHFHVISMLKFEDDEAVFAGEKGDVNIDDEAFETPFGKDGNEYFYGIDKVDLELATDLGFGVVKFNDIDIISGKLKDKHFLFNMDTFSEDEQTVVLMRVMMYLQLSDETADIKLLDKMVQKYSNQELALLFDNNAFKHLKRLNEIFKSKKQGLVLNFNSKK